MYICLYTSIYTCIYTHTKRKNYIDNTSFEKGIHFCIQNFSFHILINNLLDWCLHFGFIIWLSGRWREESFSDLTLVQSVYFKLIPRWRKGYWEQLAHTAKDIHIKSTALLLYWWRRYESLVFKPVD